MNLACALQLRRKPFCALAPSREAGHVPGVGVGRTSSKSPRAARAELEEGGAPVSGAAF